jgi:hypothetical protein
MLDQLPKDVLRYLVNEFVCGQDYFVLRLVCKMLSNILQGADLSIKLHWGAISARKQKRTEISIHNLLKQYPHYTRERILKRFKLCNACGVLYSKYNHIPNRDSCKRNTYWKRGTCIKDVGCFIKSYECIRTVYQAGGMLCRVCLLLQHDISELLTSYWRKPLRRVTWYPRQQRMYDFIGFL